MPTYHEIWLSLHPDLDCTTFAAPSICGCHNEDFGGKGVRELGGEPVREEEEDIVSLGPPKR